MGEYDEFDEVDVAMMCTMNEQEEYFMNRDIEYGFQYSDEVQLENDYQNIDARDILLDESDTDPIGMEAEDDLDAEQDILIGDNEDDDDLIDMVASGYEEE